RIGRSSGKCRLKGALAMASQETRSDVFKFVSLRPPAPPSSDGATLNFIRDSRSALDTPVGRFVSQFTPENVAGFPGELRDFLAAQKYPLTFPQDGGDRTFSQVQAAVAGVPEGSVSAAILTTAIESTTGQTRASLVTSPAAVNRLYTLW